MILLSHPTGNQNSKAVLRAFAEENLLYEFHTSFAMFEESQVPRKLYKQLSRRQFDTDLKDKIKTYPYLEVAQRVLNRFHLSWLLPREGGQQITMYDTAQYMDQMIANKIAKSKTGSLKAIYAYEDMAKRSFERAKNKNLLCLYDLPIGYWRAYQDLLSKERANRPAWADTLTGFQSSEQKLAQKDRELQLADHLFVASQFTANTLKYFPSTLNAQVHIVPYGFPIVEEKVRKRTYDYHRKKRPLKLLFIGGLSQRKGLSYLFEAVTALGDSVELTVVGRKVTEHCQPLNAALQNCHRWITTLPHNEVLNLMRQSDVLIFPSLFEGFGLVMTEAMSQGTPVIATERTAAPDILTDGVDGYIVQAGSSQDLILKLQLLLDNPKQVEQMGKAAMETAAKRPWPIYGQELTQLIKPILNPNLVSC